MGSLMITVYIAIYFAALILLDLTTVFDTVDHDVMLQLLQYFGIRDFPLQWFQLHVYLLGRSQYVAYDAEMPAVMCVPQGSVSGPVMFIMYTADLVSVSVIESHALLPNIYRPTPTILRFTVPSVLLQSTTFRR